MKRVAIGLIISLLAACSDPGDSGSPSFVLPKNTPNSFLTYLNKQAPLAQGDYEIYVLPSVVSSGSYSGDIILGPNNSGAGNSEAAQSISSDWQPASDSDTDFIDWQNTSHGVHSVSLSSSGGLEIDVQCTIECVGYLTINDSLITQFSSTESNGQHVLSLSLQDSGISSVEYANAYYKAVDPNDERTTAADWQTKNGFDAGYDTHVIFRDSKDLGYGRDMYARKNADGSLAFFVNNFVVKVGEGNPANYGPINLQAATNQDFQYHLGSNAIEFSPIDEDDPNSDFILKFFTFTAKDSNGVQHRLTSADLDGRGVKHMPTMCVVCHGGNMLPLNEDGTFNVLSLKSAKLNQLEMDSFEFMESGTYSKANQQSGIKLINQYTEESFADIGARDNTENGFWHSDFAQVVAQMRYGGSDFSSSEFIESNVPSGWQQTDYRPEGVETLYKEVVEPHCISCHSLRGYNAGNDVDLDTTNVNGQNVYLGNAINFSSYEKFISYKDLIIEYVFRRGVMPLSLRNYESFWESPNDGPPSVLASFLPDFDVFVLDEANQQTITEPGLPTPVIEGQRISKSPVTLNALGSYFAESYNWEIIESPNGSSPILSSTTSAITTLTSDMDGLYKVQLTVSNEKSSELAAQERDNDRSFSKIVEVTIDSQLAKHGSELVFDDDIKPLLQSTLYDLRTCQSCHSSVSDIEGIPVHYDNANDALYADVKARINLASPSESLLLLKPTRLQHGGGIRFDSTDSDQLKAYSTILDWAIHGAPCGDEVGVCD